MKVKLSLNEAINLYIEINGNENIKGLRFCGPMNGKVRMKLAMISSELKAIYEEYDQLNKSLIQSLGEKIGDSIIVKRYKSKENSEANDGVKEFTPQWLQYTKELNDILSVEKEFEFDLINFEDLDGVVLPDGMDYSVIEELIIKANTKNEPNAE